MSDTRELILPKGSRIRALELVQRILAGLPEKRAWRLRISPARGERSQDYNAYLWAVPYEMLMEFSGYEKDELHEFMCGEFFGWREKRVPRSAGYPSGIKLIPCRTTTTDEQGHRDVLDWVKFEDFVAFIQRFAAEKCGILIPDPDPNYALKRERKQEAA